MSEGVGVEGIGQIHVSVADLDRAISFYRDDLGLPLLFRVDGQDMAFLDCGGVRLYLGVAQGPVRSSPLVYYRVGDVEAAHRSLCERGVESMAGPHLVHRGDGTELWMAFVRDPDGNPLALMQERRTQAPG